MWVAEFVALVAYRLVVVDRFSDHTRWYIQSFTPADWNCVAGSDLVMFCWVCTAHLVQKEKAKYVVGRYDDVD